MIKAMVDLNSEKGSSPGQVSKFGLGFSILWVGAWDGTSLGLFEIQRKQGSETGLDSPS